MMAVTANSCISLYLKVDGSLVLLNHRLFDRLSMISEKFTMIKDCLENGLHSAGTIHHIRLLELHRLPLSLCTP
jgi:hypothetical protein